MQAPFLPRFTLLSLHYPLLHPVTVFVDIVAFIVLPRARRQQRQQEVPEPVLEPVPEPELEDPLLRALAPPADETPTQRARREAQEEEARLLSERIDEEISRDRVLRRQKRPVKVALLGPKRSGKDEFLTGFWKSYAPDAWREELVVWSTVIRLYLVRSVTKILDVLDHAPETSHRVDLLQMRLSPLRRVQCDLEEILGLAKGEEILATAVSQLAKQGKCKIEPRLEGILELIIASRDDMDVLWRDEDVHAKLETHVTRLDGQSRFFLDSIHHITDRSYTPSDADITRMRSSCSTARGLPEYHITVRMGQEARKDWIFYDVGWSNTQRAAWLPYLANVNAIVFHIPISAFDERLDEYPRTNRLGACLMVWKMICKSSLIAKVHLILILNGCDILRNKLERGVSLKKFVVSYGDRPNDAKIALRYFRSQLQAISREDFRDPHTVRIHFTAESDLSAVRAVMTDIRSGIYFDNLRGNELI